MANISPLAQIHPDATIGTGVTIGPFCFIDKNVHINDGTWIAPNVTIFEGANIGKNCRIFPGAVIAAIPQDLKFEDEDTRVVIGDRTTIRECATIHRATKQSWQTTVGSDCLLMAYTHIAHDCMIGNNVILANAVNLAGHVCIEDYAILEGMVAVQQFMRIGAHSFVAGGTLVRKNVPPFVKAAREPISYAGINKVGLERRGFAKETIQNLHDIYHLLFVKGYSLAKALEYIEKDLANTPEKEAILTFIVEKSPKGIIKRPPTTQNYDSDSNGSGQD